MDTWVRFFENFAKWISSVLSKCLNTIIIVMCVLYLGRVSEMDLSVDIGNQMMHLMHK